jgi:hypothetical protein
VYQERDEYHAPNNRPTVKITTPFSAFFRTGINIDALIYAHTGILPYRSYVEQAQTLAEFRTMDEAQSVVGQFQDAPCGQFRVKVAMCDDQIDTELAEKQYSDAGISGSEPLPAPVALPHTPCAHIPPPPPFSPFSSPLNQPTPTPSTSALRHLDTL